MESDYEVTEVVSWQPGLVASKGILALAILTYAGLGALLGFAVQAILHTGWSDGWKLLGLVGLGVGMFWTLTLSLLGNGLMCAFWEQSPIATWLSRGGVLAWLLSGGQAMVGCGVATIFVRQPESWGFLFVLLAAYLLVLFVFWFELIKGMNEGSG